MLTELDILRDVAGTFDRLGIEYMLTGSLAMSYYAQPRMTRDIDVVLLMRVDDVAQVIAAFEPAYYVPHGEVERAVRMRSIFNLIHRESAIKVDCIVRKTGVYREQEFGRKQRVCVTGFDLWIVSKEDLILSKLVWMQGSRSALQKQDVRNLLARGYDRLYVETWARELKVEQVLQECAHE